MPIIRIGLSFNFTAGLYELVDLAMMVVGYEIIPVRQRICVSYYQSSQFDGMLNKAEEQI
jgi:hypothetical protein